MLWLQDSFGYPMPPLKAATFSGTVQLDRQEAFNPGGHFFELIAKCQPDYGLITVVERHDRKERIVRFTIQPGSHLIDLRSAPERTLTKIVNRLRLAIDLKGACAELKWVNRPHRADSGRSGSRQNCVECNLVQTSLARRPDGLAYAAPGK